jgi:putative tryptophan/tyrosine transport system substrate-binding protein
VKRRKFITLLAGAASAWPLATRAQQAPVPIVGFLSSLTESNSTHLVGAFLEGLRKSGFVEGQNVAIEYRWAEGRYDRLASLAADLVARRVTVLISTGGGPTVVAAKAATTSIPVVFITGTDPVRAGIVASLNRPVGNLTGVYVLTGGLEAKRLGLLRELVPAGATIAVLMNPNNTGADSQLQEVEGVGRAHGHDIRVFSAANEREIDEAFEAIGRLRPGAVLVASDPYFSIRREQLVSLAARRKVPTMYQWREFAFAGGLMSYGTNLADGYHQAGVYTGRILKGASPADMPVVQSSRFELVINLRTASALGMTIPPGVLAIADEVIE